jgi:hypothetical protein
MVSTIQKQLETLEKSCAWIKTSLEEGNKAKEAFRNLVNCRRKLNRKKDALEDNPAAAMFGESQAGKSYLVSSLLSEETPFEIYDGLGKGYNFKKEVNPHGNEHESTSVVTRFSAKYKWVNSDFPVIAKLLSPKDIILIICEAYYGNLKVDSSLSFDEIKEKNNHFEVTYRNKPECQKLIIEDHVLDIEEYFENNFSKLVYNNIKDAKFFDKLFAFVTRIPIDGWSEVFSILWNFNPKLTKLFSDMINQYKQLNFVDTVYLPIDSVLRDKGTLLEVDRLDEIYNEYKGPNKNYCKDTQVNFIDNGLETTITFSKSYLCALTSELIFILPEKILQQKPFLDKTDLLDFPGTRRPESTEESNITNKSLLQLLRRGRVDYLFNKYSFSEKINVLMFCQNHKDSKQSVMPAKLDRWIGNMIGKSPEIREKFHCPISPLFIISTWFNCDLEFDYEIESDNKDFMNQKWHDRFVKVLEEQIIKSDTYFWFNNWTKTNPDFKNIYLLRDLEKSDDTGSGSKLFNGYSTFKKEVEEISTPTYPSYRIDLRQTFIDFDFVKHHFEDPAESWDRAATINEDGTKLIIAKLTEAANYINPARIEKMRVELNEISQTILTELHKHFHSKDNDKDLQKAKNIAGDIQFKLATAFSADKIKYFGQLMKELMLDEGSVLELFRKEVYDIKHRDWIINDKYSTFRIEVPVEKDDTADSYFERLCIKYEKTSDERKEEFRMELSENKIDLEELIKFNSDLIKNNAQQLAETLLKYWFEYISFNYKQTIQQILAQDASLDNIKEMYQKLFIKLGFANLIAEKIRRYVDGSNKTDMPFEIVADISTELLNKCINTVGFDYLDESEISDLRQANEQNNLGLVLDVNINPTENSVEELFTRIENWTDIIQTQPEELKSLPSYRNYLAWSNRLKVGFVSVCDIPNYDVTANANLGKIINECVTVKY